MKKQRHTSPPTLQGRRRRGHLAHYYTTTAHLARPTRPEEGEPS